MTPNGTTRIIAKPVIPLGRIGSTAVVWLVPDNRVRQLPADIVPVLGFAQEPRRLADISTYIRELGKDSVSTVAALLDAGLLVTITEVTRKDAFGEVQTPGATKRAPREITTDIGVTVWPTKSRTALLSRSISSALAYDAVRKGHIAMLISDDADRPSFAARDLSFHATGSENDTYRPSVGARGDRARLLDMIAEEAGHSEESRVALDFALFGTDDDEWTLGANRNAALLWTAGSAVLFVDDDVVLTCREKVPPGSVAEVGGRSSPYRLVPGENAVRSMEEVFRPSEEPLSRLLASVGPMKGAMSLIVGDTTSATALARVRADDARIALATTGSWGDSGFRSRSTLLERLDDVRPADESWPVPPNRLSVDDVVLRYSDRAVLSDRPELIGMCFAVDNVRLLPPFFPTGRNSDGLFAAMLMAFDPTAVTYHTPITVFHNPGTARRRPRKPFDVTPELSDLVVAMIHAEPPIPATRSVGLSDSLRVFGSRLLSISQASEQIFGNWIADVWAKYVASVLQRLQPQIDELARDSRPIYHDLERLRNAYVQSTQSIDHLLSSIGGRSRSNRSAILQTRVERFGQVLMDWPATFEAAKRVRGNGNE